MWLVTLFLGISQDNPDPSKDLDMTVHSSRIYKQKTEPEDGVKG